MLMQPASGATGHPVTPLLVKEFNQHTLVPVWLGACLLWRLLKVVLYVLCILARICQRTPARLALLRVRWWRQEICRASICPVNFVLALKLPGTKSLHP